MEAVVEKVAMGCEFSMYLRFPASIPFDQSSILKFSHIPSMLYRVVQEEKSIFYEVIISVIVRKKVEYEHVSDYELFPR